MAEGVLVFSQEDQPHCLKAGVWTGGLMVETIRRQTKNSQITVVFVRLYTISFIVSKINLHIAYFLTGEDEKL